MVAPGRSQPAGSIEKIKFGIWMDDPSQKSFQSIDCFIFLPENLYGDDDDDADDDDDDCMFNGADLMQALSAVGIAQACKWPASAEFTRGVMRLGHAKASGFNSQGVSAAFEACGRMEVS